MEDFYQIYLEELELISPCSEQEETELCERLLKGDEDARTRLIEGNLITVLELAGRYENKGVSVSDLVQEANVALTMAVNSYCGGEWKSYMEKEVCRSLGELLEEDSARLDAEETVVAKMNVLKDIAAMMAEELGREATLKELAQRMKFTEEEVKELMQLTLDAVNAGLS